MEIKFNSQICTTRSQSEDLLKLGLKKETADMCYRTNGMGIYFVTALNPLHNPCDIPAWSLHRLIEMIKKSDYLHYNDMGCIKLYLEQDDFDTIITIISIMVKEGYFNKEYLENEYIKK